MPTSPFDHLQVEPNLVCEFFGVFSRMEFALKESTFLRADRNSRAAPDWGSFAEKYGEPLSSNKDRQLTEAIRCLLEKPPEVQLVENNSIRWQHVDLRGSGDGARAIDAVQRIRNNLFHGGKHSPHSTPERDEKLIQSALIVLYACISLNEDLRFNYENSKF